LTTKSIVNSFNSQQQQPNNTFLSTVLGTTNPLQNLLLEYQKLSYKEQSFLDRLSYESNGSDDQTYSILLDIENLLTKKLNFIKNVINDGLVNGRLLKNLGNEKSNTNQLDVALKEEYRDNIVINKYIEPAFFIKVGDNLLTKARSGILQVRAFLTLHMSDQIIKYTLDGKQEILQGQTVVHVSDDGSAIFSKLKIMEVSSKYQTKAFSIKFQLEENYRSTIMPIGKAVEHSPIQALSRINKRKRTVNETTEENPPPKPRKRARGDDSKYVDITALLVLPQKEAASRLGISESMLCKRFKECTRRKWPYRYLRKIDKMIKVLTLNKKGGQLPREDQEKIKNLKKEREECLQSVKIRITGADPNLKEFPLTNPDLVTTDNEPENIVDPVPQLKIKEPYSPMDEEIAPGLGNEEYSENKDDEGGGGVVSSEDDIVPEEGGSGSGDDINVDDDDDDNDDDEDEDDEINLIANTLKSLKRGSFNL